MSVVFDRHFVRRPRRSTFAESDKLLRRYSIFVRFARSKVEVRLTGHTVEIFIKGDDHHAVVSPDCARCLIGPVQHRRSARKTLPAVL
jgi:hypothetical protein